MRLISRRFRNGRWQPPVLRALAGLGLLLLGAACARAASACKASPPAEPSPRLNAEIQRAVAEAPDSVIGVLLRTKRTLTPQDRAVLEECGLAVGSVIGDIVTGRIRAGAAARLATLPFVEYMEIARTVRIPPSEPRPDAQIRSSESLPR